MLSGVQTGISEVPMRCVPEVLRGYVLSALAAEGSSVAHGTGETAKLESSTYSDERSEESDCTIKDGRQESNEACVGREESVRHDEAPVGRQVVKAIEFEVEAGDDANALATVACGQSQKSVREKTGRLVGALCTTVSLCGERRILGGAMQVGRTKKPGLRRYAEQEHHTSSRSLLASFGRGQGGEDGLRGQGLECDDSLGERIEADAQANALKAPSYVWRKVVAKRFLGRSKVYNITVCPTHNYFAQGYLVHNCPYGCYFCADARTKLREETVQRDVGLV